MNTCLELLKRYRLFAVLLLVNFGILAFMPEMGLRSFQLMGKNVVEMLVFIPPIFVMLGLLDVWVERETLMRFMGPGSGFRGGVLAFVVGSMAAGPLYMAFPIAAMLIRKGASFLNVFMFIGAWATTKVPMLLFEASSLGLRYTLVRLVLNVCGIIAIGWVLRGVLTSEEAAAIQAKAEAMQGEGRKQPAR